MDQTIRRALTGSTEHPALTFERTFRATPADLRDACTDPDRLARWFGEIAGDPTGVGDPFTARLSDDPGDVAVGRVLRCDETTIAVTWSWQDEPESVITARITLVDADRTTLALHHELADATHLVGYGGGWEQTLRALARGLETGPIVAADDEPDDEPDDDADTEPWRRMSRGPLVVERVLAAPVERVWHAFTTSDGLRSWWWRHWSGVLVETDTRVGGSYRIEAPDAGIVLSGHYLAIEEPRHLSFTWSWRDADGEAPDEAVDVRLDPEAGGTRVVVRHTGPWADDAPAESYRQGWEFTLGQLAESLV